MDNVTVRLKTGVSYLSHAEENRKEKKEKEKNLRKKPKVSGKKKKKVTTVDITFMDFHMADL